MPPARRRTTRTKEFTIFLPPKADQITDHVKIEIISGSTTTDVTDDIQGFTVTKVAIDFLTLANVNRKYLNTDGSFMWSGGETVKVYQDYTITKSNLTDTELLFKGRMHAPLGTFGDNKHSFSIFARKLPELKDRRRVVNFPVGTTFFSAANQILADYTDLIDTTTFATNLSGDTGVINASFDTFDADILREIFRRAGWTGYFDNDEDGDGTFDLIGFSDDGNTLNEDVASVAGQTMLSLNDFGVRTEDVFTRVRVEGANSGGGSILREDNDDALETSLWRRDARSRDQNVLTMAEADSRLSFELAELTQQVRQGSTVLIADRRLNTGQRFRVHSADDGVNGYFKASRIDYSLDDVFTMNVSVSRRERKSDLLRLIELNKKVDSNLGFDNPNDMKFSFNFPFDDNSNISVSAGVEFVQGDIRTTAGEGSFTSNLLTVADSVTKMDFVFDNPQNVEDSTISVSANRGDDETTIPIANENIQVNVVAGTQLRVSMVLTGSDVVIGGLTVRGK